MENTIAQLRRIFPTISPQALEQFCTSEKILEYPAGTFLCKEDNIEMTSYILLEGRVDVFKHVEGEMQFVDSLTEGYFGEIALLLDCPRTADVVAADNIRVLEINRMDFEASIQHNPEFVIEVLATGH